MTVPMRPSARWALRAAAKRSERWSRRWIWNPSRAMTTAATAPMITAVLARRRRPRALGAPGLGPGGPDWPDQPDWPGWPDQPSWPDQPDWPGWPGWPDETSWPDRPGWP